MADVRRILVILVIAVLFVTFVQVSIDAIFPNPEYDDYCDIKSSRPVMPVTDCEGYAPPVELIESCEGNIDYKYDSKGCPVDAYCETCYLAYDKAREQQSLIIFIISSIAGIAALVGGLNLPMKNPVNEWIGSGFLLGGIITIATGTARYFGAMARWLRPIVIGIELVLVIYLTYKKLGPKGK